ncbi:2,5-dihydroxypyridine 5,6-dioxygenase [Lacisediminimonas sp.]|uniref:2,5-dihydroxypyridine 5,6-dioxygenase n=1 Tax=Lacisediminimonas sp. TaxID=3060582 RepID=UPI002719A714|nr:2,5-dihydroxypyridine 5,6-dioxygenase [Lacisediminimonas sp.]MDO8298985.1 2,5-dihydroxypyridine 5,6-dioxygenase [Lacisediminimonas sp.]
MATTVALLNAWKQLLTLCKLNDRESVVILLGDESHPDHVASAKLALTMLGARSMTLQLGETSLVRIAGESTAYYAPTGLTGNLPALEAMKRCDLVIDLMGMYRGSEQEEILAAGTRIILVKEPPEVFLRLMPSASDRERVLAASAVLSKASTMHVTSAAGSDLTVRFGQYSTLVQYGFADEPGRWDHCPSAFTARWPDERSANGTIVLSPGDTILPFKSYVQTPITLSIKDGAIYDIAGALDARYLRDYMATFNDPDGYAVSHLGWGLHRKASWTALGMYDKRQTNAMDARSFYGSFMFSTGPNAEGGGTRHTPCHLDIPMLDCSVWVDGVQMVDQGDLVAADQRG